VESADREVLEAIRNHIYDWNPIYHRRRPAHALLPIFFLPTPLPSSTAPAGCGCRCATRPTHHPLPHHRSPGLLLTLAADHHPPRVPRRLASAADRTASITGPPPPPTSPYSRRPWSHLPPTETQNPKTAASTTTPTGGDLAAGCSSRNPNPSNPATLTRRCYKRRRR
jgi:hypothetical protein